ncbi:G-protein coupled receptor 35-like [Carassius auratus]|uniref:G-protein coupled receptor 35-like n=1 Tax=Carassius auratus TaxID=7957 RepID=A0A6P6NTZ8_CARAU|nr:G-protein coupled receptor 35-like [Carassius auratus]
MCVFARCYRRFTHLFLASPVYVKLCSQPAVTSQNLDFFSSANKRLVLFVDPKDLPQLVVSKRPTSVSRGRDTKLRTRLSWEMVRPTLRIEAGRLCVQKAVAHLITMSNTSSLSLNSSVSGWRRPLWYQYEVCADAPHWFIFYFGVKVLNLVAGFPMNALVLWQILRKKSEGSTSDVFILNLSILDAYFGLMTPVDMANRLYFNDASVWYSQRFAYGLKDVTPLFLTCICLDRYIAVVHPILFTGIRDTRFRIGVSLLVWGLVLAYSLTKCILGVMSVNEVFSGVILSAFFIMMFCNLSIIWVLRKSVAGKEVMNPVKKKAFKMVIIVLAIIVGNYLPPVALMPFASTFSFKKLHCKVLLGVFSIMDLSCTIEPLLYISKMDRSTFCRCLQSPSKKPITVRV